MQPCSCRSLVPQLTSIIGHRTDDTARTPTHLARAPSLVQIVNRVIERDERTDGRLLAACTVTAAFITDHAMNRKTTHDASCSLDREEMVTPVLSRAMATVRQPLFLPYSGVIYSKSLGVSNFLPFFFSYPFCSFPLVFFLFRSIPSSQKYT